MKILQINSVYGEGSTGKITANIHDILLNEGHESYVASGNSSQAARERIKIGNKLEVYKHAVLTRTLDKHGFGSKTSTEKFINRIKYIDPDVIHLHNIHGYYINIEVLFNFLKEIDKPVIWTLHDCWAFTGHCAYFDFVGCNKWVKGCFNCPEKKSYPASFFKDNSKKNYIDKKELFTGVKNLTIVTPSEWLAKLVKRSFLSEYEVKVINNGIDLSIFKPTKSDFKKNKKIENKFMILGVASIWDRRKGLDYFLKLSEKISENEVIVLLGLNNNQMKNLPDNIIGISKTNNIKNLAEIYTAADVFLNPTLEDNFPTTNLESLACGTPVITFATGGSVESINENTGCIVEKGNCSELLKSIKYIKKMPSKSYYYACIDRANNLYNKEDKFHEYINLYSSVS